MQLKTRVWGLGKFLLLVGALAATFVVFAAAAMRVAIRAREVQVPILLGRGVRLWDGLEALEQHYDVEVVSTPSGVTHLTFTR